MYVLRMHIDVEGQRRQGNADAAASAAVIQTAISTTVIMSAAHLHQQTIDHQLTHNLSFISMFITSCYMYYFLVCISARRALKPGHSSEGGGVLRAMPPLPPNPSLSNNF